MKLKRKDLPYSETTWDEKYKRKKESLDLLKIHYIWFRQIEIFGFIIHDLRSR